MELLFLSQRRRNKAEEEIAPKSPSKQEELSLEPTSWGDFVFCSDMLPKYREVPVSWNSEDWM